MGFTLLLVGCGKMGSTLLDGWLAKGIVDRIVVVQPSGTVAARYKAYPQVQVVQNQDLVPSNLNFQVIVFAVKPGLMAEIMPLYARFIKAGTTVLSIAAGETLAFLEKGFPSQTAIVRAMPNLPAAVGRGITVACANPRVTADQKSLCHHLFEAVGKIVWITAGEEKLMDAVTALSGSGPAYVFLLMEAMAKAGEGLGLSPKLAEQLARQTVIGAAALADSSSRSVAQLREDVTSPQGTTAAALDVLTKGSGNFMQLFEKALAGAAKRSKELSKE